jgi:DNA-binding transcriptional LysR family regulator
MIRLDDLTVFVQAAVAGSLSAAARQLDITPAAASSAVQRLERELGQRLFVRSTRSLRLSDDGERYLPHARLTLQSEEDGRHALERGQREMVGHLRLSAPSDLGRNLLLPWLDDFQREHPRLTLQLRISDRVADLYRQPLDLAIRYGTPADSGLIAQPLAAANRRVLCAAPAYLQRCGTPATPDELRKHACLRYVWGDSVHERWSFHLPRGVQTVTVAGDRVSDDADVVRRWALAGHGLVYKSRLDVAADLHAGRLRQVFPLDYGEPAPLNLVCAHRSLLSPVMQRLRDFLRARCDAVADTPGR